MASPQFSLPANHFLSLPRPTFLNPQPVADTPDLGTTAGADYDVDVRTGFMPPSEPVKRLPDEFAIWERTLDAALASRLKVGDAAGTTPADWDRAASWRETVRELPRLSISSLRYSVLNLRRAHQVLTCIMHFYVHSMAPSDPSDKDPIVVPSPIAVPLVAVSHELGLHPILTYSDTVLWNWSVRDPSRALSPSNIRCHALFSSTPSEEHFFLVSGQIELRGVEALDIMRSSLDEAFVSDAIAIRRISAYLGRLSKVIDEITDLLMSMREGCEPAVFYNEVRPWFRGSSGSGRDWTFEGVEAADALTASSLSGPSAGQSTLIHALDVFLGVDHTSPHSHAPPFSTSSSSSAPPHPPSPTFMTRMEKYMPGPHRRFLHNLRDTAHPIRPLVLSTPDASPPQEAYDNAVLALKRFRDAHIRIVTLYIINPSRAGPAPAVDGPRVKKDLRGTGGTALVPFLKETRGNTQRAILGKKELL